MPDDKELASVNDGLAEAMASIPDEPLERKGEQIPEEKAKEPAPAQSDDRPRDEHGRFAPKTEEEPESPQAQERDGGFVPSWRLREEREERERYAARAQAAERQAWELNQQWQALQRQQQEAWQAQQQQFQAPDPINDPQGYHQYWQAVREEDRRQYVQALENRDRNFRVQLTFEMEKEKNPELFEKAFDTLEQRAKGGEPHLADRVRKAPNPGKALMQWYQKHVVETEIGGDPDGWRKREQEKWENDPEVQRRIFQKIDAQARGNGGRSFEGNVSSLPSVNRATGAAGRQQLGSLGDNDREIFDNLTRKR